MQQENPISVAVLNSEDTNRGCMQVNYYLKSREYKGDAPHLGYGIEARLFLDGRMVDGCTVDDVTCKQDEMLALIDLLSRNTVTPVSLKDVIEDHLAR
jgi:hypothetical protein